MGKQVAPDTEKVFELRAYFSDLSGNRYIGKYSILYSPGSTIETQQLGIFPEHGNKKFYNN